MATKLRKNERNTKEKTIFLFISECKVTIWVNVTDVTGWFKNHTGIKDLTPLRYTLVDSLKAADMKPLTQLERIAMPMVLVKIEDGTFADAKNLRWADFMLCDNADLMADLQNGGQLVANNGNMIDYAVDDAGNISIFINGSFAKLGDNVHFSDGHIYGDVPYLWLYGLELSNPTENQQESIFEWGIYDDGWHYSGDGDDDDGTTKTDVTEEGADEDARAHQFDF